jgi:hypothetical protein
MTKNPVATMMPVWLPRLIRLQYTPLSNGCPEGIPVLPGGGKGLSINNVYIEARRFNPYRVFYAEVVKCYLFLRPYTGSVLVFGPTSIPSPKRVQRFRKQKQP